MNRPVETGLWNDAGTGSYHRGYAYTSTSYTTTSGTYEQLSITHYDDYSSLPSGLSVSPLLVFSKRKHAAVVPFCQTGVTGEWFVAEGRPKVQR